MPSDVLITPASSKIDFTDGANATKTLKITGTSLNIDTSFAIGATTANNTLSVLGSASIGSAYNIAAPTNGLIVQGDVGIGTTSFVYSNAGRGVLEIYGTTDSLIALKNATASSYLQKSGNDFYINNGGAGFISIVTNSSERWRITSAGVLQSNGAQTLQTNTGNLTLATAASGHVLLSPTGGNVGIGTASPGKKLQVVGSFGKGLNLYEVPIDNLVASGTQAKRYEIARVFIDYNDWNSTGPVEIEVRESYYSDGRYKRYVFSYGYNSSNAGSLWLVEDTGRGDNDFKAEVGSAVLISGDIYYVPIYIDLDYYQYVDVIVRTNRTRTTNASSPSAGVIYINESPTGSNISSFSPDEVTYISLASSKTYLGYSGNVGIGTTNPSQKLDVRGNIKLGADNAGNYIYYVKDTEGTIINTSRSDASQQGLLRSDGWGNFTVDKSIGVGYSLGSLFPSSTIGNGNLYVLNTIGVNTTSPLTKLDVRSGSITAGTNTSTAGTTIIAGYYTSGALTVLGTEQSSGGPVLGYAVTPSTSGTGAFLSATSIAIPRSAYTQDGGTHRWYIGASQTVAIGSAVTASEVMRINSSGNVGVGTTTVSYKLHVQGDIYARSAVINISGDLNALRGNVTTMGYNLTNSPSGAGWITVNTSQNFSGGGDILSQLAYDNYNQQKLFTRHSSNYGATWSAWKTIINSDAVSGTTNYVAKFTGTNSIGNSLIFDNGTNVAVGSNAVAYGRLQISATGTSPSLSSTNPTDASLIISNSDIAYGTMFATYGDGKGALQQRRTNAATYYDFSLQPHGGNIGIGALSPLAKLHVAGTTGLYQSANSTYLYYDHSGVNTWRTGIFTDNTSSYIIGHDTGGTFATKILTITMGGNVSIGTTSPSAKLHLNSTTSGATLLRADGTNGTLFSVIDDLSDSLMSVNNSAGLPVLEVFADDRVVMGQYGANDFVLVNNKIGLGTNNPQYELDIVGPGTNAAVNIITRIRSSASSDTFNTGSVIAFTNTTTNVNAYSYVGSRIDLGGAGDNAQALIFATNATNTLPTEKMRIKSDGNVGINTASPAYKLDVNGTSAFRDTVNIGPNIGTITWGNFGGGTGFGVRSESGRALSFGANGSFDHLVINTSGNVGIGTSLPSSQLEVGNVNTSGSGITVSARYDQSEAYIRFRTGHPNNSNVWETANISATDGGNYNGTLSFRTAVSGQSSPSTKMTILPTGNVGVGTVNPLSKLAINGVTSVGPSSKLSLIGLDINSGATPTYVKIVTTIPVVSPSADFTVNIKGFIYGSQRNADISISWHYYLSTFYNPIAKSSGGWAPTIRLSAEGGFVAIVLSSPGYWPKFYVESMYSSAYSNQYSSGWSWVDADATGSPIVNVPYASNFGNNFVMLTDGNVGVGTASPSRKLHVYSSNLSDNTVNPLLLIDGKFTAAGVDSNDIVGIAFRVENSAGGSQTTTCIGSSYQGAGNALLLQPVSGNVGVGTINPSFKFEIGAGTSNVVVAKLTQGYERVRYYGFDLLGYNDGNLWMMGNNATSTILISKDWDWDTQIGIAYTPGTVGVAGGSLEIGQLTKNNANFTHGNTRFYTNGVERLRIISNGYVGIGTTAPAALLQIGTGTPTAATGGIQFGDDTGTRLYRSASGIVTCSGTIAATFSGNLTGNVTGNVTGSSGSCTGNAANVTGTVAIANGGTGATTAANARTNLGATTVGANFFTLTNPSAITFPRINADNTVSALDAATFRTAIGAGTGSGNGTVTSVGGTGTVSGLTLTGTVTTTGNLTLGGTLSVTASNFASQTANTFLAAPNGAAGVPTFRTIVAADVPTLNQSTTGNAATASLATTSDRLTSRDNRTISSNEDDSFRLRFGFTSWANNDSSPYADYLHLRSYSDASGGNDNLVMFRKDAIGMRIYQAGFGTSVAYSSFKDVAFTDQSFFIGTTSVAINRGSAALTLNGVNISGTAASETFATVTGRGASTTTQISVATAAGGSMYTGTKVGTSYGDGISGATFKSITDNPNGGSYAFAAYFNGVSGTNSFFVGADGSGYFRSTLTTSVIKGDAGADYPHSFTNTDSGNTHWTNRNGRLLTSNGAGWQTDGRDPIMALVTSGNSNSLNIANSIGLALHNESATNNTFSPAIAFSNLSNSGGYNTTYAAIIGRKTGQGIDTNWSAGELHFYTMPVGAYESNIPSLIINSAGNLGIGTTNPVVLLQVGTGTPTATANGVQFGDDTSARLYRSSSGVVSASNSFSALGGFVYASNYLQTGGNLIYPASFSATQRLEIGNAAQNAWITGISIAPGGNVVVAGTLTESSSIRYKENIETISAPILPKLNKIRPVTYNKKDNPKHIEYGIIAEELNDLFPELVNKNDNGEVESVNYSRLTVLLIKAVKELKQEIEILKNK
jgi:hypothetical protein